MADLRTPEVENLLQVLATLNDKDTLFQLLEDMFTIREIRESSQRLQVARLLDEGKSYTSIEELTGASATTIARVSKCLAHGSGGYRAALNALSAVEVKENQEQLSTICTESLGLFKGENMKRLLVVVDYQNDFVDGALGFEGAELLDERIAQKIDEYREAGDIIYFTFDTHHRNYLETQEGQKLPVTHCIEGTDGHDLYGEVAQRFRESDLVLLKPTFGSTALFERLMQLQATAESIGTIPFESIQLVGLVSNMCVLSNAVIARTDCPDVPIIVDASCTAAPDSAMNEKALDIMEGLQIEVINRQHSTLAYPAKVLYWPQKGSGYAPICTC